MSRTHVTCTVNGDEVEFLCDDDESLLDALRDEVGLIGAKEGCGTGDCGACSIIMDGRLTCSCLVFAAVITNLQGRKVHQNESKLKRSPSTLVRFSRFVTSRQFLHALSRGPFRPS